MTSFYLKIFFFFKLEHFKRVHRSFNTIPEVENNLLLFAELAGMAIQ